MIFGMFDPTIILLIPTIIFTAWAQAKVRGAYGRYSQVPNVKGLSGAEVARYILDTNGLQRISIEMVSGTLSDHFDPRKEVVRLSPDVYQGRTIAAVSIAAHETGHAIQYGQEYFPLKFRNALAKPVSFMSMASWPLLVIGLVIICAGNLNYVGLGNMIFDLGVMFFAFVVLFHGITLPVELNASKRALEIIQNDQIVMPEEYAGAKKVLSAAAMTYVAALATAVMSLIRILIIRGRN
jgi:Zn-dependent membrane protease YugP